MSSEASAESVHPLPVVLHSDYILAPQGRGHILKNRQSTRIIKQNVTICKQSNNITLYIAGMSIILIYEF